MRPHVRSLHLVRHAQSAGNVANDAALAAGRHQLDLAIRDMDVPLSELGEAQARALGGWFDGLERPPDVVVSSPYRRAVDTAKLAMEASGTARRLTFDERLREREFGILDRLTKPGIEARFPEQAAARAFLGKLYHRPPGGESWADVAARVRAVLGDLRLDHADEDVVLVTHQAVIMLFRYVIEGLDEQALLAVDRTEQVANTAVSTYVADDGRLQLVRWNDTAHLPTAAETDASDVPVAPR
ncbi:MAG: histidine phosphatase family protein [Acidimicrobiales bacterium]